MKINSPIRGKVEIEGNIRGLSDIDQIKTVIDNMRLEAQDSLALEVKDSFSMPSALIGYLLKLVEQNGVNLNVTVGNEILAELLEDLNLKQTFKLKLKKAPIHA
jgi:predicted nucleotidyltransferase